MLARKVLKQLFWKFCNTYREISLSGSFWTKGSAKYVLLEIYEIFNVTRQLNAINEGMMELLNPFISTSKIVDLKLL